MKKIKPYVKGFEVLYDKNGNKLPVEDIVKPISHNYFWKVKMMDFLTSLDVIGNKSVMVYSFILGHIDQRTNKLKMTNKQIIKGIRSDYLQKYGKSKKNYKKGTVSTNTVSHALAKLEHVVIKRNGKPLLIRKRYGRYGKYSYIMINPAMLMRGRESKRQGLLIQYKDIADTKKQSSKRYKKFKNYIDSINHRQKENNARQRKLNDEQRKIIASKIKIMHMIKSTDERKLFINQNKADTAVKFK